MRAVNARAAIGAGLMGGAHLVPGIGGLLIGARAALSGIGFGMVSYEAMRKYSDEKELAQLTFTEDQIKEMPTPEIENALHAYEAQAGFAGKSFSQNETYKTLITEYKQRAKKENDVVERIVQLDNKMRAEEGRLNREDKVRMVKAAMLGVSGALGIEALRHVVTNVFGSTEAAEKAVAEAPIATVDEIERHIESTAQELQENLPHMNTTEVIEKGGSVWKAAHALLEKGVITKEQFNTAWASDASFVKTPGGKLIPLHNLDYVHPGTTVRFVAQAQDVPAHFEIGGNIAHTGDSKDLLESYRATGKKAPDWLVRKVGIEDEIKEGKIPQASVPHIQEPSSEFLHADLERAETISEGVESGEFSAHENAQKFSFGTEEYVYDKKGRLIDVNRRYYGNRAHISASTRRAVQTIFVPDYESRITRSVEYYHDTPQARLEEAQRRIWAAREAAREMEFLRETIQYRNGPAERVAFALERMANINRLLRYAGIVRPNALQW
jgi:hypothetical protein